MTIEIFSYIKRFYSTLFLYYSRMLLSKHEFCKCQEKIFAKFHVSEVQHKSIYWNHLICSILWHSVVHKKNNLDEIFHWFQINSKPKTIMYCSRTFGLISKCWQKLHDIKYIFILFILTVIAATTVINEH